ILATIDFLSGHSEQALDEYTAQYQSSQRGDPQVQIWALAGLAQTLARMGRAERAIDYGRRAVELLAREQGRPEQIFARAALARALLEEGESAPAAVAAADEALAAIRQGAPVAFYCINAYAVVAEVYLSVASSAAERTLLDACKVGAQRALDE